MDSQWNQIHKWPWGLPPSTSTHMTPINPPEPQQAQWQPQPPAQLHAISHAIFPSGIKENEIRKYTAKDWEEQRPEIARLYEDNTLSKVMELMREQHGLDATPKQYKDRIKKWDLKKNIQPDEMEAIIRKQRKRVSESNKRSAFRVRKRPVPQGKIDRYIAEHDTATIAGNYDKNIGRNTEPVATPAGISCYTPSDTGYPTPHAYSSPLATSDLPPSITEGPYRSSYHFGNVGPTLPGSPWVAQIPSSLHRSPSSPIPIAALPTPSVSALIGLAESTFAGQSPAPFSVPSTPRADHHDLLQNMAMEVIHDGGNLATEKRCLQAVGKEAEKLACELSNQGRYKVAEQLYRQVLELRQKALGFEHPNTLASMDGLACTLMGQGRYRAAERMHRETLQLRQKVLGPEHPHTLRSMGRLASVLGSQGKYIESKKIQQQTLLLSQKVLGSEHPDTLKSMGNLVTVLYNQGKNIEAEKIQQQTLQLRQKVLGPEHPDTLWSMSNLASSLSNQGKHIEAEKIQRQTLLLSQKVLGPEHPGTLRSMGSLAFALGNQGKHIESEKIQRQTLQLSRKVLGPEHPDTLRSMGSLASALGNQGKHIESEKIQRQTLQLSRKVLGPEHPNTLRSMGSLATTLRNQGKIDEVADMALDDLEELFLGEVLMYGAPLIR